MPTIHHTGLNVEAEVSEDQAEILTTNPRVPWKHGPLKSAKPKPTAKPTTSPEGDPDPLTEED